MDIMIPDLPGFDTSAALRLLGNNEKLYVNVLKRFRGQYAGNYEILADTMLHSEDWETIQREAHTIKGLAGTIGHPGLQQAALELEMGVKDAVTVNPEAVLAKAKDFLNVFSVVLCQLGQAFSE